MSMGKRIEEARIAAKISKSGLARAVGVSASAVTQWLSDETKKLEGPNLLKAAKALNVSPDWLSSGRGPRTVGNTHPGPDIKGRVPLVIPDTWV